MEYSVPDKMCASVIRCGVLLLGKLPLIQRNPTQITQITSDNMTLHFTFRGCYFFKSLTAFNSKTVTYDSLLSFRYNMILPMSSRIFHWRRSNHTIYISTSQFLLLLMFNEECYCCCIIFRSHKNTLHTLPTITPDNLIFPSAVLDIAMATNTVMK